MCDVSAHTHTYTNRQSFRFQANPSNLVRRILSAIGWSGEFEGSVNINSIAQQQQQSAVTCRINAVYACAYTSRHPEIFFPVRASELRFCIHTALRDEITGYLRLFFVLENRFFTFNIRSALGHDCSRVRSIIWKTPRKKARVHADAASLIAKRTHDCSVDPHLARESKQRTCSSGIATE